MRNQALKIIEKFEKYIILLTLFLFPSFVIPILPNPFVVSKIAILTYAALVFIFIFAVKTIISGKFTLSLGSFDLSVFLIGVSFLASSLLRTSNKMEAFLLPGTASIILISVLFYFFINQRTDDEKKEILKAILASAIFFSLLIIFSFIGVFAKIPQLPTIFKSQSFSPEGGFLPSAIFLLTIIPIGIGIFLTSKEFTTKLFSVAATLIILIGLAVSIFNLLPGKPFSPRFPDIKTSWNIAVDALKESPILGIGPGNYLTAFNRFRPISYNNSNLWAVKFATANNFYLTTLTEVGMFGASALILLLISIFKKAKEYFKEKDFLSDKLNLTLFLSLLIMILSFGIFPATLVLVNLFFILLALNTKTQKSVLPLTTQPASDTTVNSISYRIPAFIIAVPILLATVFFFFQATKIFAAEYEFQKSLNSLARNQAQETYDTIREAIKINPKVDRYHITFAQVNLALANAIAQKAATTSGQTQTKLSDQDRQTMTILIQQAINEGKAAVALNPLRSANWEILGQVYRSIIPLARGADNFAIQTYRQAIALDPINPNLRIQLGGIYYAKGDFDTAVKVLELATTAKPDHANAHYNLAFALRERNQKGDLDKAISEMTLVLSLVNKDSNDYEVARKALEDLQAKKTAKTQEGTELTSPPSGEPIIKPPLELPEESRPPEAPITPTTPTPLPSEGIQTTPTLTPTP